MVDLETLKNNTSIIDYGEQVYGFTPVKKRNNYWGFKDTDVDSIMVDTRRNCFFHNSEFVVGAKASENNNSAGSILDFIMNIEGCSVKEAIKKLRDFNNVGYTNNSFKRQQYDDKPKVFVPPVKYNGNKNKNALRYLCYDRQIEKSVFYSLVKRKMLYEEKGYYRNAIFAAYDDNGKMIFAQRCSTKKNIESKKRKRDVSGSSYEECYFINNGASSLIVSEATIDELSFMSLLALFGKRFNNYNHLGLTGTNKILAIFNILEKYPNITKLYLAFDNDEAGHKAYKNVVTRLNEIGWCGQIIDCIPSVEGFDMNDVLKQYKASRIYDEPTHQFFFDRKTLDNKIYKVIRSM